MRHGKPLAVGGDDQRIAGLDAGDERPQYRTRALTTTGELSRRIRFVERLVREVGAADDSMFVRAVLGVERHVEVSLDKFEPDRYAILAARPRPERARSGCVRSIARAGVAA